MQKCKYNDAPFVPSNDCSSWESCTQDAYERGKADGRKEAIEEFYDALACELTWRLNTGDLFLVKRVAKAVQEKLKEREDGN